MTTPKDGVAVRVPWGTFDPRGPWRHNPALPLSATEQRAQNEANGHACPGNDGVGGPDEFLWSPNGMIPALTGRGHWAKIERTADGVLVPDGKTFCDPSPMGTVEGKR